MEPNSIKCHACSTQYTPSQPYLCFFFFSTILSLHHSSPLHVIPKQNLSIHDSFWRDIFKASLSPTVSTHRPSLFISLVKPPTQSPFPRLKRCLWIFNGAIVLLCVRASEWRALAGSPYFLVSLPRSVGDNNKNSWAAGTEVVGRGQGWLTLTCCTAE